MKDREILGDILLSQKSLTESYNNYANECATPVVRDTFMSLLHEEHKLESLISDEMSKRGWNPTPAAEQSLIQQAREEFQISDLKGP